MLQLFKSKKAHWGKTHIMIGLVVLGILWYANTQYNWMELPTDNGTLIQLVIIGVLYSTMPDVDNPNSIINKYVTTALVGIIIWAFYTNQMYYGIIAAVIIGLLRLIEHRTLIHSVLGAIIIAAPLLYFSLIHFIVGFVTFVSHIVADNEFSFGWEKDWKIWK